jgi:hypothetical protein
MWQAEYQRAASSAQSSTPTAPPGYAPQPSSRCTRLSDEELAAALEDSSEDTSDDADDDSAGVPVRDS